MSSRNRVTKTNSKSSDRRLASGIRPESFLLSQQRNNVTIKSSNAPQAAIPESNSPAKFRLFVGNLGPDANTAVVQQAFSSYPSLAKVEVPMGPKDTNKGYAFVSFTESNDYLKAFREVQGKYIGLHPCVLKRANDTKDKNKSQQRKRK